MYDITNMNAVEELIYAKKLGRQGLYNNKAPCQDKELMNMFAGMPVGSPHGMNLINAWENAREEERENSEEYQQMLVDVFGDE